jgi:hypothetical protein
MHILRGRAKRRALQKLARELPLRLMTDYGASEYFTVGQIGAALSKLGVAPEYVAFGFAMFLPQPAFDALRPEVRGDLSYLDARAEMQRHRPQRQPDSDRPYDFSVDWSNASSASSVWPHGLPGDGGT